MVLGGFQLRTEQFFAFFPLRDLQSECCNLILKLLNPVIVGADLFYKGWESTAQILSPPVRDERRFFPIFVAPDSRVIEG